MNENRFAGQFGHEEMNDAADDNLEGFVTNPLAGSITLAQSQLYQAAYLQAKKDLQEPEWPLAECWN
jgi:hypothetical protein